MKQNLTLVPSALIALAIAIPCANAAKPAVTGIYDVVGSSSCQSNEVGFSDYPYLYALGTNYQVILSWQSRMQFNSDGTASEVNRGQYALPSAQQQPVGTYETACTYTSRPNPDGTFRLIGACDGHVLSGVAINETNHLAPAIWKVTPAAGMILLSQTGADVETLSGDLTGTHYRICQGTAIGVK